MAIQTNFASPVELELNASHEGPIYELVIPFPEEETQIPESRTLIFQRFVISGFSGEASRQDQAEDIFGASSEFILRRLRKEEIRKLGSFTTSDTVSIFKNGLRVQPVDRCK